MKTTLPAVPLGLVIAVVGITMFSNQLGINVMECIGPYFSNICSN
jgi:hypothetical protein